MFKMSPLVKGALVIFTLLMAGCSTDNSANKTIQLPAKVSDGPYVFVKNNTLNSYWICRDKVVEQTIEAADFPYAVNNCHLPATLHGLSSTENNVLEFKGDFTVAALSDFHGQYDLMIELLTHNKIIDENGNWAFDDGHFVITGDIFDRGDKVTEILWFLYDLEQQVTLFFNKMLQ